jgi:hypothetical protein
VPQIRRLFAKDATHHHFLRTSPEALEQAQKVYHLCFKHQLRNGPVFFNFAREVLFIRDYSALMLFVDPTLYEARKDDDEEDVLENPNILPGLATIQINLRFFAIKRRLDGLLGLILRNFGISKAWLFRPMVGHRFRRIMDGNPGRWSSRIWTMMRIARIRG